MWVSPNHPTPPRKATPPEPTGRTLAKLRRSDDEVLRVALADYKGNSYVSLRVWARGQDGQWWPVKGKGCSIRIRELAELAEVLHQAAGEFDDDE